jgi:hypothetical protein
MCYEGGHTSAYRGQHVKEYKPKEQDKVFVIPIAQTIVNVDAVMVELFHTTHANHAVKGPRRFDNLTVEAKVLEVNISIVAHLQKIYNAVFPLYISRIHTVTEEIEYH